jgi:hypothetical protein
VTADPAQQVRLCDFSEVKPRFRNYSIDEARRLLVNPSRLVWVDMQYEEGTSESTLAALADGSSVLEGLDPNRATRREDNPSRRPPKAKVFHHCVFARTYALKMDDERLAAQDIHLVAGQTFAITLRYPCMAWSIPRLLTGDPPEPAGFDVISIEGLERNLEEFRNRVPPGDPQAVFGLEVAGVVLDDATDSVFDALDELRRWIDEAELEVLGRRWLWDRKRSGQLDSRLLELRRALRGMRWAIMPSDEIEEFLAGPFQDVEKSDPGLRFRLDDLARETGRALDTVRETFSQVERAVALGDSVKTDRLNTTMYVLTAVTTVLLIPTLIAGLYGMNFENLPGFGLESGHWWVFGSMALLGAAVWVGIQWYLRSRSRSPVEERDRLND